MTDTTQTPGSKTAKPTDQGIEKPTPVARMSMPEVDAALADCEKTVKTHTETVKAKLTRNAAIPPNVMRELSRANTQKSRLVMRRFALLVESGDSAVMELLDKLMKIKPQKATST